MRNPFKYFKTSPEIIRLAVMMYIRFPLSLRDVEDLPYEREIGITHETARFWWNRFGPLFAAQIRRCRGTILKFSNWAWQQRMDQFVAISNGFKKESQKIENEINALIDQILKSGNTRVIAAYENRIEQLERDKLVAEEKAASKPPTQHTFDEWFERAPKFLSSPYKLGYIGEFPLKRAVLELAFSEVLQYCRESGFREPKTTLPFRALGSFPVKKARWCPGAELNHRHADFQSAALPLSYPGTVSNSCLGSQSRARFIGRARMRVHGPFQQIHNRWQSSSQHGARACPY